MNRVIIDKEGKIQIKNKVLIFEDKKIPLRYIDFLILAGKIEIDTKTIVALGKENISILIYNRGFSFIHPINSKNAELKKFQFSGLNKRVEIAKFIVKEKIKSGCDFLSFQYDFNKLNNVNSIDEILGIEGSFAREYFKKYFSLFPKFLTKGYRSKRPPEDVVNAFMSFMYTLLYYEITNKLIMHGLDPQIGYLHEPFRSHNALSSDILEFFRSDVDRFVLEMFLSKKIQKKDFDTKYYLRKEKRKELWKDIKNFLEKVKIEERVVQIKKLLKE
jgi:CRISPR-associated protein Cas1